MNFDALSDDDITALIEMRKRVSNPGVRWSVKPGHKQRNFKVKGGDYLFELYERQGQYDIDDFSCGLKVIKPDGQPLTLLRHNGSSHLHGEIKFQCHIHRATKQAMLAGRKPESFADVTDCYHTLQGALCCLVQDASIEGLADLRRDEPDLFSPIV